MSTFVIVVVTIIATLVAEVLFFFFMKNVLFSMFSKSSKKIDAWMAYTVGGEKYKLAIVGDEELGINRNSASLPVIYLKAKMLGLSLCPKKLVKSLVMYPPKIDTDVTIGTIHRVVFTNGKHVPNLSPDGKCYPTSCGAQLYRKLIFVIK